MHFRWSAACKLFSVVMYDMHMTVYRHQKGDVVVDANVPMWCRCGLCGALQQSQRAFLLPFFFSYLCSLVCAMLVSPTLLSFLFYDYFFLWMSCMHM